MKIFYLIAMLFISFSIFSLENYIGFTPKDILEKLGSPSYVLTQRGDRAEEDDVVFFYDERVYIYFNQNRVWQMRVDENYPNKVLGLSLGNKKDDVIKVLGDPLEIKDNSYSYRMPDQGYPLILKIYFQGDILNDIYLYRGDY